MATVSDDGIDPAELNDVFAAPPAEFISARNSLARELREEGRGEDAERVRKLRKPTRPAWLLNQLSRRSGKRLESWADLVESLREAGEGSVDAEELRRAAHEEDEALDELVRAAADLAGELGEPASDAVLTKVRETLEAAAVDPAIRSRVLGGTLEREERAASIGFGAIAPAKPGGGRKADGSDGEDRRKRKAAERELVEAERELERAEGGEADAADRVDELTQGLAAAREERKAAAKKVKKARRAVTAARRRLPKG